MASKQNEPPQSETVFERYPALKRFTGFTKTRRVRVVRQSSLSDCGPACLAMVLDHFGKEVELDDVRQVCGSSRQGFSAAALFTGAALLGLRGRGVRIRALDQLRLLEAGATILHWKSSHY